MRGEIEDVVEEHAGGGLLVFIRRYLVLRLWSAHRQIESLRIMFL